jgi:hypothetical protein
MVPAKLFFFMASGNSTSGITMEQHVINTNAEKQLS